ncbi:MAG: AAA family ATPase [Candidatus Aminicenantes bacterium]|nr:AAA family ATPase [Candidatus Aminicenantes bacterium]
MKIRKIKRINNLGTFNNFQWQDNCQEFGQYNFFYGWNYSGKTTLSRIFRCLQLKKLDKNLEGVEFILETDNGDVTQRDISEDYPIRVFNEDFVEDNFHWNDENAKIDPVLILGEKAKELEDKVKELSKQKEEKEKLLEETKKEKVRKEQDLDNSLTNKASEIREILKITNPREFDKNKLKEKIDEIKDSYKNYILSDNEKEKRSKLYESKKQEKIILQFPTLKLSRFISEVKSILSQKVTPQRIIEKLRDNPKLSNWVKEGIDLHRNEKICHFCGNQLPQDLFDRLNKHFSQEFDKLMEQIEKEEKEIQSHIEEIKDAKLPDRARLFEDLQLKFENKLNSLNSIKNDYIQTLNKLKKELDKKREKPFDSLQMPKLDDNTQNLENILKEIQQIIDEHNSKVDSFETEKQEAKEKLINHYAAEFIEEKNYFNIGEEIDNFSNKINTLQREVNNLNNEIDKINNQIKAEVIGARRMNKYLKQFFNDDKLRIETTDDGKYKLYRDDKIAKNLSTGEKNIITLIYFFTKLEETGFDFNNAVIFIDDPVSSLDSNHIFKVYGFISEKLKSCGQLFITTHNFDFFNLLKDLNRYELGNQGKFYLVKKVKNQSDEVSCIENLPKVLLKYKSEYNYLFSILKTFNELNNKQDFELLYLLPNILRRYFEAYLFMKYPDGKKFKDKAEKFLEDTNINNKQSALKLMDEYSHEENPEHSLKFPDIQEVENAVKFILEIINKKDKEHYEALCNSL